MYLSLYPALPNSILELPLVSLSAKMLVSLITWVWTKSALRAIKLPLEMAGLSSIKIWLWLWVRRKTTTLSRDLMMLGVMLIILSTPMVITRAGSHRLLRDTGCTIISAGDLHTSTFLLAISQDNFRTTTSSFPNLSGTSRLKLANWVGVHPVSQSSTLTKHSASILKKLTITSKTHAMRTISILKTTSFLRK